MFDYCRYRVHEFIGQKSYIVDLSIDVCLDTNSQCSQHYQILNSTKLIKAACEWDTDSDTGD